MSDELKPIEPSDAEKIHAYERLCGEAANAIEELKRTNSGLRSKLAIAVEALEEMNCSCYPYHKDHDSEDCAAVIAKEALAKIRS